MNIVEAYIKLNKKLVIFISGLSGSGKSFIAQNIAKDFNIRYIDLESYCKKDFNKKIKVSDSLVVTDWDNIESYDWIKLNKDIEEEQNKGVLICGYVFPKNKITFIPTQYQININDTNVPYFHIHVKISKQKITEYRHNYIKKHKKKCSELLPILDTPDELLLINNIVYPYYTKYLEMSIIHKFLNGNNLTLQQMYDQAFEFLIEKIKNILNEYNSKLYRLKKSQDVIDDDNIFYGERRSYDKEYIADELFGDS
jgi:uridine kinase